MKELPPNVYLQSYLQKAGVRFDINIVDTIVRKGFGFSFYILSLLLFMIIAYLVSGISELYYKNCYILLILILSYLILYVVRIIKFRNIRKRLRINNPPIVVEAYAIVLFDMKDKERLVKARRSAILYKECGSVKPRFFTGAVKKGITHHYYKDQLAQVFIDRKDSHLYTVDDDKFYETVSEKQDDRVRYSIRQLATKMDKNGVIPDKNDLL